MDEPRELFWEDLDSGEVHIRDKWQFTLKSEFFPLPQPGNQFSLYTQEFYLFIPNSLQINKNTYSKNEFYLDETNFIRYKTPEFTFAELLDLKNTRSPLNRIIALCQKTKDPENLTHLSDELKLLANVVRSSLRKAVKMILFSLGHERQAKPSPDFGLRTFQLCKDIQLLRSRYHEAERSYQQNWKDPLFYRQLVYIDEFMNNSIAYYMTGLLDSLRLTGNKEFEHVDQAICDLLVEENRFNDTFAKSSESAEAKSEGILYRFGLLNKFILDALTLTTNRFSLDQRTEHWIGGLSAALAMLVYISLFFWLGNVFVINSFPFLMIMIIVYVLKDRIKEWLKSYSYLQASRWFPDYITIIKKHGEKKDLGYIKESFSFLTPDQLPKELSEMRNFEFHKVLEAVPRPENIIFYKRIVKINAPPSFQSRRLGLNVIFRYNIHRFLNKAADPSEMHLSMDNETKKILSVNLPKVYHLNLIIRTTAMENGKATNVELKKLRLIVDKNGIKRIEHVGLP